MGVLERYHGPWLFSINDNFYNLYISDSKLMFDVWQNVMQALFTWNGDCTVQEMAVIMMIRLMSYKGYLKPIHPNNTVGNIGAK